MNKTFTKGGLAKEILQGLAVETVVLTRFMIESRAFNPKNSPMKKMTGKERGRLKRSLFGLQKNGLITLTGQGENKKITLTEKGKQKVVEYDFYDLEINQPKKWDGKWRIVMFDVPEEKKRMRKNLWWKFKDIGFYLLQKSTYVFPYDCRAEIEMIKDFWGDYGEIIYIVGDIFDQKKETELKKFFKLK